MKKMRRMIPALCMLLVSAIMLSTASYAWFTMNEKVEATGMQVQAQAGGAMVIGTTLLHEGSQDWTVDFATDTRNKKIGPMARLDGKWQVPNDGNAVDGVTGHYDGEWKDASGTTYIDYTVYIAVTGDEVTKNIKATLSTESTLGIAGAYAVAFYVDPSEDEIADKLVDVDPDLILHVASEKHYGKYTPNGGQYTEAQDALVSTNTGLLFESPTKIDSTIGVAENSNGNGVGTKIVMRVFVDGTLRTGEAAYVQAPVYEKVTADATYNDTLSYFVGADTDDDGEADTFTPASNANINVGEDIPDDWYIYRGMQDTAAELPVYYVRNKTAPEAPTGLNVAFELVDDSRAGAADPEQGN